VQLQKHWKLEETIFIEIYDGIEPLRVTFDDLLFILILQVNENVQQNTFAEYVQTKQQQKNVYS